MSRQDINRSGEMEVFVRAVELGGFSAAATACKMTPSAVSKLITRLEARLGTRLVNRSTRKLQLTPEGSAFYQRSVSILADISEAERYASSGEQATGPIRINTSGSFGNHVLAPLLPAFMALHPAVTLDISHTDKVIDLMEERADVAIRTGPLKNSSLIARKLGVTGKIIVASPDYLRRHGEPLSAADLARYVGTYQLPGLKVRMFAENGRLNSQGEGQGVLHLKHLGGGRFVAEEDDDIRLEFPATGTPAPSVIIRQGGRMTTAPRVP